MDDLAEYDNLNENRGIHDFARQIVDSCYLFVKNNIHQLYYTVDEIVCWF